jgi:hypothetical protein
VELYDRFYLIRNKIYGYYFSFWREMYGYYYVLVKRRKWMCKSFLLTWEWSVWILLFVDIFFVSLKKVEQSSGN